jgi:hypothetical protein
MTPRIVLIVSDHGFGHAGRCCAFLPHLVMDRAVPLLVVSGVPLSFFIESLVAPVAETMWRSLYCADGADDDTDRRLLRDLLPHVRFLSIQTDVGVKQTDAISIDLPGTVAALDQFCASFDASVAAIADEARRFRATHVVFDISSLGPAVAASLNVPSLAISNFDWCAIYESLGEREPRLWPHIEKHRALYRLASQCIVLPGATPMQSFSKLVPLPGWTGRRSLMTRENARAFLRMTDDTKYVMTAFGGHNAVKIDAEHATPGWRLVCVDPSPLKDGEVAETCSVVERSGFIVYRLAALRQTSKMRFVDVIAASDVVLLKPGYGTVSEVILNGVPALWVSRPNFSEEQYLVAELERHTATLQLDADALADSRKVFAAAARVHAQHARERALQTLPAPHNETLVQAILDWAK